MFENDKRSLKELTLLYVEDDLSTHDLMRRLLHSDIHSFISASTGKEALELFKSVSIDLILTDIEMPDMNGLEFAAKIKERSPYTPVIVLSAHQKPEYFKKSISIGVDGFISKPVVDIDELLDTLWETYKALHLRHKEIDRQIAVAKIETHKETTDEIFKMVTHQWSQPLTVMSSKIMEAQVNQILSDSSENMSSVLDSLSDDIKELSTTLNKLQQLYQDAEDPRKYALDMLVKEALIPLHPVLRKQAIALHLPDTAAPTLHVVGSHLIKTLQILIQNAIDILQQRKPDTPQISISYSTLPDAVRISISDNGGGIDENIKDKLFEPYTSTKSLNRTGLGLYIAKTIVEHALSGSIQASNEGDGASFSITLPNGF